MYPFAALEGFIDPSSPVARPRLVTSNEDLIPAKRKEGVEKTLGLVRRSGLTRTSKGNAILLISRVEASGPIKSGIAGSFRGGVFLRSV